MDKKPPKPSNNINNNNDEDDELRQMKQSMIERATGKTTGVTKTSYDDPNISMGDLKRSMLSHAAAASATTTNNKSHHQQESSSSSLGEMKRSMLDRARANVTTTTTMKEQPVVSKSVIQKETSTSSLDNLKSSMLDRARANVTTTSPTTDMSPTIPAPTSSIGDLKQSMYDRATTTTDMSPTIPAPTSSIGDLKQSMYDRATTITTTENKTAAMTKKSKDDDDDDDVPFWEVNSQMTPSMENLKYDMIRRLPHTNNDTATPIISSPSQQQQQQQPGATAIYYQKQESTTSKRSNDIDDNLDEAIDNIAPFFEYDGERPGASHVAGTGIPAHDDDDAESLPEATPFERSERHPVAIAQEKVPIYKKNRLQLIIGGVIVLFVVIILSVVIVVGTRQVKSGDGGDDVATNETMVPTPTLPPVELSREESIAKVITTVSPAAAVEGSDSQMALRWIIDEDELQLDVSNTGRLIQRFVLALFYYATGGDATWFYCYRDESNIEHNCTTYDYDTEEMMNWTTYLSPTHECTWYGTYCDETDEVAGLIMVNNNFTGTIPSELARLSSLSYIDFSAMEGWLGGTIPEELGFLRRLTHLDLGGNRLEGTIPESLYANLTVLNHLSLVVNYLTGTISRRVGMLESLEGLYLDRNMLTGGIPEELGDMPLLQWFYAHTNRLTGTIPSSIGKASMLKELRIYKNILSGSIPSEMGQLSNLELLMIDDNRLSGTIPDEFYNLSNLYFARLFSNRLTGTISSKVENLSSMRYFFLNKNYFNGTVPMSMANIDGLTYLWLHHNDFTGHIPPTICTSQQPLTSLYSDCGDDLGSDGELTCTCCTHCCETTGVCTPYAGPSREESIAAVIYETFPQARDEEGSDAYRALRWLTEEDGLMLFGDDGFLVQRFVLAVFYYATGGGGWRNCGGGDDDDEVTTECIVMGDDGDDRTFERFMSPVRECDGWYGVTCSDDNEVTGLVMVGNGLNGTIPSEISHLTSLEVIDVSFGDDAAVDDDGQLVGMIPENIYDLTALKRLSLVGQSFQGTLSRGVGNLTLLEILDISGNQLTGSIPDELGNLQSLNDLRLNYNNFMGTMPSSICNLEQINSLYADCASNEDTTTGLQQPMVECSCCTHCCRALNNTCIVV